MIVMLVCWNNGMLRPILKTLVAYHDNDITVQ